MVIIEANLSAAFGPGQLRSYAAHLGARNSTAQAVLALLVPANRSRATAKVVRDQFPVVGDGPAWQEEELGIVVTTLLWEEVFDCLADRIEAHSKCDLEQLCGLYTALVGLDIAPLNDAAVLAWRAREGDFRAIVDRATRKLTTEDAVYPMREWDEGYVCRYVGRQVDGSSPMFSIGLHEPFDPYTTPIWLRYHRDTPLFRRIQQRVPLLAHPAVESGGHLWFPLQALTDSDPELVVDAIVAEAEEIHHLIWN